MENGRLLAAYLAANPDAVGKVVDFDAAVDRFYHPNLTAANPEIVPALFNDTVKFSRWMAEQLDAHHCRYGMGGYLENRAIYARSELFDSSDEPRRVHLGVDIWGAADTPVYSPLDGKVHSFRDNDNFGDYGPTIILQHNLNGLTLYSLYGHLNRKCLQKLKTGQPVSMNEKVGNFGNSKENGQWPPHLHFQLMFDIEGMVGDYPGVCRFSEKDKYIKNIPDPQVILQFPDAVNKD